MEGEIQKEMLKTAAYIKQHSDQPINPKEILASSVMNTLWKYAAGKVYLLISDIFSNFLLYIRRHEKTKHT